MSEAAEGPRRELPGQHAGSPGKIPAKGWWQVVKRVAVQQGEDNIALAAAGVAFYALLALFPAITALVLIYGLWSSPADVQQQAAMLQGVVPEQAMSIIDNQLNKVASTNQDFLSYGLWAALLVALWISNNAVKAIFGALNIAYNEVESRSFFMLTAVSLTFTLGLVVAVAVSIATIVGVPAVLAWTGLGSLAELAVRVVRWPILAALMILGLALVYRFGPSRRAPRWQWLSPGAVLSTLLWIIASIGFSIYVTNFGSYTETYGSLGAVVVLLFWLWISAYVILLGAELNAELEHQTERDTTVGGDKPMGQRGAYVADHLPPRKPITSGS